MRRLLLIAFNLLSGAHGRKGTRFSKLFHGGPPKQRARSYTQRERSDHTLQPTALINEAYLRLARDTVDWQSRQHFIGVAANVMRRLLVDHAGAHNAEMRAGGFQRVELEDQAGVSNERPKEVLGFMRHSPAWKRWIRGKRRSWS